MNRTAQTHQPEGPSPYQLMTLGGIQKHRGTIYGGSVPAGVIVDRRRKNKAARKSRRINRGGK